MPKNRLPLVCWPVIARATAVIARQENEEAIRRLRRAWEIDAFPTGYEVIRILDVP